MKEEIAEYVPLSQMEDSEKQNSSIKSRKKGGLITIPFIIANEALESVASYGLLPNMTFYLMRDYRMDITTTQNLLFFWSAATNFLPIVGAVVADSYLGRFLTIGLGSIFSFMGTVVLWLTAMIPKARPPPCNQSGQACKSTTTSQYMLLVFSFLLMSIGAGGIRSSSLAFGANQLDKGDNNPNKYKMMESFFTWYYTLCIASVLIALTGIVYLQDRLGWKVGFGVPAILMFLSALSFYLASPFYIKPKGTAVLWLTAMIPRARPPPCNQSGQACKSTTTSQYMLLVFSFLLMSIGAGGIRPCSLAFGANQFDKGDNNSNKRTVLESFFAWYYTSSIVSVLIALTGIVYLQDRLGWKIGFGVPAILMFLSALFFFLASPFYIKPKVRSNVFASFIQVLVVACKNRKLRYPNQNSDYHHKSGSGPQAPSDKLRFLNKACIIKSPEDVKLNGGAANPWNLCTVEQVEELKSLIRVMPLWSTGIMISINLSQSSFPLLQAQSMNRHLSKGFQIPAGSFGMFMMIALTIWVFLYDRVMLPLASKIRGRPVRLKPIVRMGIGIFISCMSMVVSGIVEHVRRRKAINQGLLNNSQGLVEMSALWLIIPNSLNGIAEAFSAIGSTEFYYSELPKSMSSIASALLGLGMAVASLLASVVLSAVDKYTKGEGTESWVSSNINKGHYEYYYWLLAVLTAFNLLYFVACCRQYGPSADVDITKRMMGLSDDDDHLP